MTSSFNAGKNSRAMKISLLLLCVTLRFGCIENSQIGDAFKEKMAELSKCLQAAKTVQKDPGNNLKTSEFLGACNELLKSLPLTEKQTQALERLRSEPSKNNHFDDHQHFRRREEKPYVKPPIKVEHLPQFHLNPHEHFDQQQVGNDVNMKRLKDDLEIRPQSQVDFGSRQWESKMPNQFQQHNSYQNLPGDFPTAQGHRPPVPNEFEIPPMTFNKENMPNAPYPHFQENFHPPGEHFHQNFANPGDNPPFPDNAFLEPSPQKEGRDIHGSNGGTNAGQSQHWHRSEQRSSDEL